MSTIFTGLPAGTHVVYAVQVAHVAHALRGLFWLELGPHAGFNPRFTLLCATLVHHLQELTILSATLSYADNPCAHSNTTSSCSCLHD